MPPTQTRKPNTLNYTEPNSKKESPSCCSIPTSANTAASSSPSFSFPPSTSSSAPTSTRRTIPPSGRLLTTYAGRPTPLTRLTRLTEGTKTTIYLKREDLLHGGAHKTNQVLGQALLTKRMGKTRVIAETGAGQHGVATALASALFGFRIVSKHFRVPMRFSSRPHSPV